MLPTKYLEDSVIDAFGLIMLQTHNNSKSLIFSTQHVIALINETYCDTDILECCKQVQAKEYKIFIFPIYSERHLTLLTVIPKRLYMVYLDSRHRSPETTWISVICGIGNKIDEKENDFLNWTLYEPKDIPKQMETEGSSGNCGVHLCAWEYIDITGNNIAFEEN